VPNARNSEPYDDRGPCVGYGTCDPVCPSGAKYSADHTIAAAEERGVRVLDRVPVQRLETGADGERVTAAVYATPDGTERRQHARRFVLAAGGVEIPRLLLLSRSGDHPDGLANSSGAVGRYFSDHLFAGVDGTLDRATRQNHVGFITTESHAFYDDPGRSTDGTDGGIPAAEGPFRPIKLEFLNYAGPSPVELALSADEWGDALLDRLRASYGTHLAVGGLVGQEPRAENRVALDTDRTDDHGTPVPDVRWRLDARTERTLSRANRIQRAILEAAGAEVGGTVGPDETGPAYHHCCTTRMTADPDRGVVDPRLRTHDVENLYVASSAAFTTPGSVNPTLTIAALALRCGDAVSEDLAQA
jgi:choline dehydrogenase-like flavoprotein